MRFYQYLVVCLVPFPASAQNRSVWSHFSLPSTPTPAISTSQALPATTPQDAQPAATPLTPTSPTPYSNSRTNPGTATSTSPPSAIDACWTTPYCQAVLGDISYCYNTTGAMQDPNHNSVKDQAYQTCLCSVRGPAYKNILSLPPTSTDAYPLNCFTCLSRAGLDTSTPSSATQLLKAKFSGFCNALPQNANLYDLLTYVLAWVQSAGGMGDLPGDVQSVTQWKGRFTSTPGMNQPTTQVSTASATSPGLVSTTTGMMTLGRSQSNMPPTSATPTPTPLPPFLTPYANQIPENWPYTHPAVARHAGQVTSLALTGTDAEGMATGMVGWVYASLRWNPRVIYTARGVAV